MSDKTLLLTEAEREYILNKRAEEMTTAREEKEEIERLVSAITNEEAQELEDIVEEEIEKAIAAPVNAKDMQESIKYLETKVAEILYFVGSCKNDVIDKVKISKEILKLTREVHELRLNVDKLAPKIGVAFWGFAGMIGLVGSFVFPELKPLISEIIKFLTRG